jgi:rare lipoprotein A
MYIQAGAFSDFDNANRLRARLTVLGPTRVSQLQRGNQTYFRVRIGPVADLKAADAMLERVIRAGHPEARLIVDR